MKNLRIAALLLVGVVYSLPALAGGGIGSRNLDEEIRARKVCVDYAVPALGTDVTPGETGIVFYQSTNGLSGTTVLSATSSVVSLDHPAKLTYDLHDATTADTLTCTSLVIVGTDQFGKVVRYTDATMTETAETTTQVFSTVTSISITGCQGSSDAGDAVYIYVSPELGLLSKVRAAADIESVCIKDAGDSDTKCAPADYTGSVDIAAAYELSSHSIDVSTAMFGDPAGTPVAAADGDTVCWRVRPSF